MGGGASRQRPPSRSQQLSDAQALVASADTDGDGQLSLSEVKAKLKPAFSARFSEALFQEADADADGHVSVAELSVFLAKLSSLVAAPAPPPPSVGAAWKPHVTLSTQYQGQAFERSKGMKALLEQLGCSVYNPNTDCPQKPGDTVKGASNWLEEFRKSLKRSVETCGYEEKGAPDL